MKTVFLALVLSASLLANTAQDLSAQDDKTKDVAAQDVATPDKPAPQGTAEGPEIESRFALDFTTQYFYRGFQQENGGFIVQPSLEFSSNAYEGKTAIRRVD